MKNNPFPKKANESTDTSAAETTETIPTGGEGSAAEEATETPTKEAAETPEKQGAEAESGTEVSEEFKVQADDLLAAASPAELAYIQQACEGMASKSAASSEPTMEDYEAAKEV